MAYTRPDYNAAHANWVGLPAYTRPAYNAADATWYTVPVFDYEGWLVDDDGVLGQPEILAQLTFIGTLADSGLPLEPSLFGVFGVGGYLADEVGMLQPPTLFGVFGSGGYVGDAGLPLPFIGSAYSNPIPYIDFTQPVNYALDVLRSDMSFVRVPISSWQATLQTDNLCYSQAVIPACSPWLDAIVDSQELIISMVGRLLPQYGAGMVETQLVRSSVSNVQETQGPTNHTAVIFGSSPAFPAIANPDPLYDRVMTNVRQISVYANSVNMRCEIDWLLMPGVRATYGNYSFVVGTINYYATVYERSMDAYMDIASQAED